MPKMNFKMTSSFYGFKTHKVHFKMIKVQLNFKSFNFCVKSQ